jgi:hypothetical protein
LSIPHRLQSFQRVQKTDVKPLNLFCLFFHKNSFLLHGSKKFYSLDLTMYILHQKSCVKKFQLEDNKPKKNSKARVFQWFIELKPKRNQRQALGNLISYSRR